MLNFYDCVAVCTIAFFGFIAVLCITDAVENVWKNKK